MMIKFNFNNYQICSMCHHYFKKEDLYLCDGIIGKKRALPFGKWENWTCDKPICKNCKKQIGGCDFCNTCYQKRK